MKITDILAKIASGGTLTTEDVDFVKGFDYDKAVNDASASARRKAEDRAKAAEVKVSELEAKVREVEAKAEADGSQKDGAFNALKKTLESLQKSFDDLKAEADKDRAEKARLIREQAISRFMDENGIKPAKGISERSLSTLFRAAVGDTDVEDASAMRAVAEAFKKENGGMIAAPGSQVPNGGKPSLQTGENPFKTGNATAQAELFIKDPELAKRLAAEAGTAFLNR